MTDTIVDDDLINSSKPTTSGSNSSVTTADRRSMFIETEARSETITRRRVASTTGRSVYDILKETKSPTDGLPPTTYTYAHSVSYMPVAENGTYEVPVMARRDLHGEYRPHASSSFTSTNSFLSSPARLFSNVRSQLVNSYSSIRDRFTHQNTQHEEPVPILNSPTITRTTRFVRTSSQSSASNGQTTGYNLRRRPLVHSTPLDNDSEQRRTTTRQRQDRESQDDRESVEGGKVEGEQNDEKATKTDESNFAATLQNLIAAPFRKLCDAWMCFINLPWWLLIPLLLLLSIFLIPNLSCRFLKRYPESKVYQRCQEFQQYRDNLIRQTYKTTQNFSFSARFNGLKTYVNSLAAFKDKLLKSINDCYRNTKKWIGNQYAVAIAFYGDLWNKFKLFVTPKPRAAPVVSTPGKADCSECMKKVNDLIEEFNREKAKYLETRAGVETEQDRELEPIVRKLLEEYAADETGQADYALEANGGKIVDTRCTEYTDEPRQNVVKFLGIPIVHMSKQPDIMIKAGRMPGQCFPFKGDLGSVIIKLAVPVKPSEFALEHLSKSISVVGHINSAPKNFAVYALKDKNDKEGTVLGRYSYDAENGPSLQRFKPQLPNVPLVEFIELRVTSNWGNPNYTCVYRFRVHGDLPNSKAPPAA